MGRKKKSMETEGDVEQMEVEEVEKPQIQKPVDKLFTENLPWVEKYRPTELDELVSQKEILTTITNLIERKKLPHLLFYGPPGTGKTTTILALARKLYGKNYQSMILELNASDDRGIDVVREQIKSFANTRNIFNPNAVKLIVLDEADAMTGPAQAALRRVIEKYTKTTRFCLICNYLSKIIPALQSRCTRFRFAPLKEDDIMQRLQFIAFKEGLKITDEGMKAVIRLGQGDMRKCLNILQAAHMAFDSNITEENVYTCTGQPQPKDITNILEHLLNSEFSECYKFISELQTTKGLALQDIVTEIHGYMLRLDIPSELKILVLDRLAETEYRLSAGSAEKVNLGAVVGAFQHVREQIFKTKK